jgi:exodeoxyribonuclease VIII
LFVGRLKRLTNSDRRTSEIKNIGSKEYHSGPGISKSGLDLIARSPAHYKTAQDLGRKDTPALIIGSAFHTATLEPEKFDLEFAVLPEGLDRRTKAGKEEYAAFESASIGKSLLKADDATRVMEMARSVRDHPTLGEWITGGKAEQSVFWWHRNFNDTLCKCRPDYIKRKKNGYYIVDLKSTEDARPWPFERSFYNYRYHVQSAYYWDGCTEAFGEQPRGFIFIAVEKEPPYAAVGYEVDMDVLNGGRSEYLEDLAVYRRCVLSGEWPSYPAEIRRLTPPKRAA